MGHLAALMKKNWTLWRKGGVCSCLEIIFPVSLVLLLFIFRNNTDTKDIEAKRYLEPINDSINEGELLRVPYELKENADLVTITDADNNQFQVSQPFKPCLPSEYDIERIGYVALAPDNSFTRDLQTYFSDSYNYESRFFANEKAIFDEVTKEGYEENICFGLSLHSNWGQNNKYGYNLHFNVSAWDEDEEHPDTQNEMVNKFKAENIQDFLVKWVDGGFMRLQNWVDNLVLKSVTGNQDSKIEPELTSQKIGAYTHDKLPEILKGNLGTYIILPQVIVFLRMTYQILEEKEKKIKESMKIMGLSDSAFYLSWIFFYGIIYVVVSLLITIFLTITIYPSSNFLLIFIWFLLFCLSLMSLSLLLTTFFSRAKMGNVFGMVIFFSLYIVAIVVGGNDDMTMSTRTGLAFLPHVNCSMGADVFLLTESTKKGIGFSNMNDEIQKFTILYSILMFLASIATFLLLALYLDQVIPGEFGAKKHPLFIFPCILNKIMEKQRSAHQQFEEEMQKKEQEQDEPTSNVEEVDGILKDKEKNDEILKIIGLCKTYSNGKKAVRNLNLTMYKDQISCLLGHNGSGKTTTISMLTGMIGITSGEAKVFGKDVQVDMKELRSIMGVCPQHDILYPNLTVREHLEMFAQFKGMKDPVKINEEIEQLLVDVDLKFKEHAPTKSLSGGQKRRVSIAIAFIGGSKLVYLDEPTSGCDTSVRRRIWDMLRKYKNDRIVVLTTHFMDEADYLGDRISIIGAGQLICSGSPLYLKNEYGVGYNLTIIKQEPITPSEPIIEVVKRIIPDAHKGKDVSAELPFQLSINSVNKFQELFNELDSKSDQLQIANYGISITTMEEVFLQVAHSNAKTSQGLQHSLKKSMTRQYTKELQNPSTDNVDNFDLNSVRIKSPVQLFFTHFWALVMKRVHYFKRDKKGLFCEMVLPCILIIVGLWSMTIQSFGESEKVVLEGGYLKDELGAKMPTLYGGVNTIATADLKNVASKFNAKHFKMEYTNAESRLAFDDVQFSKKSDERVGGYFFDTFNENSGTSLYEYEYLLELNTLVKDGAPLYVNRMNEALLQRAGGSDSFQLEAVISPFPYTQKFKSFEGADKGIQSAFIFACILSFIPASLVVFIVREREEQVKHQQCVSGVSLISYWSANYFLDLMKYYFPCAVFSVLMFLAYDIETYTKKGDIFSAVIMLFLLYGLAVVPFTYLTSFLFRKYGNAQVLTFFVHYLMGGVAPLIIWLIKLFIESARPAMEVVEVILKFFPSFAFGYGMINLGSIETFYQILELDEKQGPYDWSIAGGDIVFMVWTSVFYFVLIFVVEYFHAKGTVDKMIAKSGDCPQYQEVLQDDDVQQEINVIDASDTKDYVVRVNKLRKVYKVGGVYNPAVQRVSFGIKNGECFTLLGVNGAGKTTIFKILSGDTQSTTGSAHINGFDVSTEMSQARYHIGYCPQFDALLENLTSREHLELYAAIKGIPKDKREELVAKKIKEMELANFENVCAGTYSGGNKRKLSVAIAMLGNPPIVFLDEPSTGMDPVARRYMWDVISRITTLRKQSSVLLTTHSMEEAEALSTRMAIQVAGLLKCIGPIQHIKSRFGGGYEVEVKLQNSSQQDSEAVAQNVGLKLDFKVDDLNLQSTIQKLGYEKKGHLVAKDQIGEDLYNRTFSNQKLELKNLIDFFLIEDSFEKVAEFIGTEFGTFKIIEHFGNYSRYKIQTQIPTGKIFGGFEGQKEKLKIASYSVKQATIESIFNEFAVGKIDTAKFNQGGEFAYESPIKKKSHDQQQQPVAPPQKTIEIQNANESKKEVNIELQQQQQQQDQQSEQVKMEQVKIGEAQDQDQEGINE